MTTEDMITSLETVLNCYTGEWKDLLTHRIGQAIAILQWQLKAEQE